MGNLNQRFRSLTDEEEARIQGQIAADPEDGDATEADLAQAKPFAEVFPDLMESIKRGRGRPPAERPKVAISIRLDQDVIAKFKATGPGWQSRMNDALKVAKV